MTSFWMLSRYPQLNQKALMGGDTSFSAIGFDILFDIPIEASKTRQALYHSINWMYTNWRGMLFGLLMGTLLLTLLPLVRKISCQNRFANSLIGLFSGAPLGVCVNCATPIASGVMAAGNANEIGLALLLSSPTLNIIVITMVFALFPFYMAVIKITFSLLMILLIVPLLLSYTTKTHPIATPPFFDPQQNNIQTWKQSFLWLTQHLLKNLWYIIKITLPLMFLSAILGGIMITVIPLESWVDILPQQGRLAVLLSMLVIAFVALFLPVPIAFDVIVSAILLQAGLPISYSMVLLFTLGIFSVYPFLIIWQTLSHKLAYLLVMALIFLALLAGVIAHRYAAWDTQQQEKQRIQRFSEMPSTPKKNKIDRSQQGTPQDTLLLTLKSGALSSSIYFKQDNLIIRQNNYAKRSPPAKKAFSWMKTQQLGFNEHDNLAAEKFVIRLAQTRGIASGDIHNDGWSDIVISSNIGIGLYANLSGKGYEQQRIDIPEINQHYIGAVALVDLNNDGWLDLFVASYGHNSYIIENNHGKFTADRVKKIPNHPDAVFVNAPAFGDIDKNGELDIILANSSASNPGKKSSLNSSRNIWLQQHQGQFEPHALTSIAGESLTALIIDFNLDGWDDLIIGNEFQASDMYYLNDGHGEFKKVTRKTGLFPYTATATMSLSSADLNNDLIAEIFVAQKAWKEEALKDRYLSPESICDETTEPKRLQHCLYLQRWFKEMRDSFWPKNLSDCLPLNSEQKQNTCIALQLLENARIKRDKRQCRLLSKHWPKLAAYCLLNFSPIGKATASQLKQDLPQKIRRNMLFMRNKLGFYDEVADKLGLMHAGWAWNAKFADLNNDEWQDLYVVTGMILVKHRHSNRLFYNQQGQTFIDASEKSGLASWQDVLAYTYTDMDNDGDLDIITVPSIGQIRVYRNNNQSNHSICFSLRDYQGNSFGIGSKIIIYYGNNRQQMREIKASGGYLSFDAPIAYFGLGRYKKIKRIAVHWSTGKISKINHLFLSGKHYKIIRQNETTKKLNR